MTEHNIPENPKDSDAERLALSKSKPWDCGAYYSREMALRPLGDLIIMAVAGDCDTDSRHPADRLLPGSVALGRLGDELFGIVDWVNHVGGDGFGCNEYMELICKLHDIAKRAMASGELLDRLRIAQHPAMIAPCDFSSRKESK
jgi:hypothetical protein